MKQGAVSIGFAVALAAHGLVATALLTAKPYQSGLRPDRTVELEVVEPPPPPPPPPPAPEPPPPAPKPPRQVVMRRVAPPPLEAPRPPPPNEPPPEPPKEATPPVFGVTIDSTVTGEAGMAVPVGDTTMTPDRTPRKAVPSQPAIAEGPPAFAPVPDSFVAQMPQVIEKDPREKEGDGTGVFPPEAKRLGLEGQVVMRVGIDRHGVVRSVRVVKKAGYGFDEAASQSIRRYKWSPARTNDGRAVDFLITFKYTFGRRE